MTDFEIKLLDAIESLEPEAYGVPIADHIEKETGKRINPGSMYVALFRMEERAWIYSKESEEGYPDRGGLKRRYYFISHSGRRVKVEGAGLIPIFG